jgi:hypothetical protein
MLFVSVERGSPRLPESTGAPAMCVAYRYEVR